MTNIPNESNFYAMVHTADRDAVVAAFQSTQEWMTRPTGETENEAQSVFGELVIEAELPVLVHGPLAKSAVARVNEILASIGVSWSSELYDMSRNLISSFGDANG